MVSNPARRQRRADYGTTRVKQIAIVEASDPGFNEMIAMLTTPDIGVHGYQTGDRRILPDSVVTARLCFSHLLNRLILQQIEQDSANMELPA